MYFWLDPKVPKNQGLIKISCFLRNGLFTRYKPLQRTSLRLLLYRLLKAGDTILPLKTCEIFIRPPNSNCLAAGFKSHLSLNDEATRREAMYSK